MNLRRGDQSSAVVELLEASIGGENGPTDYSVP
jgi:hypothetical protein